MEYLYLLAKLADAAISMAMKIYGLSLWFKGEYLNASIVMGMSGLYSISMAMALFMQESLLARKKKEV